MDKIEINVEQVLTLTSKRDWIRKCPNHLPKLSAADKLLFVDKNGNSLTIGKDFSAAETQDSYPVKVYKLIRVSEINN